MTTRSLWWKLPQESIDIRVLFEPLHPIQVYFMRIQVRDALEQAFSLPDKVRPDQRCSEEESIKQLDWQSISSIVNEKCPDLTPHEPEVYCNVWSRVWLTDESTVFIHDEKLVYELLPAMIPQSWFLFYNLGYFDDHMNSIIQSLIPKDEKWWEYSIGLYHHVGTQTELKDKDVIEIGCGRGGGASHITRTLNPKTYRGMDVSKGNIEFCKRHHNYPGLTFLRGDAIEVPLEDSSCDVLLNVESSHSYTSMHKFIKEVNRLLRPGGQFVFVDSRHKDEINALKEDLQHSGLKLIKDKDISSNVAIALSKFKEDIPRMLDHHGVKPNTSLRNAYEQLLYDLCNRWYPHFSTGKYIYISCTLQKPK